MLKNRITLIAFPVFTSAVAETFCVSVGEDFASKIGRESDAMLKKKIQNFQKINYF